MSVLDAKIPEGPIKDKWTNHKNHINVVNPANKRLIDVIIVGTGFGCITDIQRGPDGFLYVVWIYIWRFSNTCC